MVYKRQVFELVGVFDLSYKIAMDYDHIVRMHSKGLYGQFLIGPVVEMDGKGISATSEQGSIDECLRSLRTNNHLKIDTLIAFIYRLFKFKIRNLSKPFFGDTFLKIIKEVKYKKL
jgi:hypothetical protein